MAEVEKTEYHLVPPVQEGPDAVDWFDDKQEAIDAAAFKGLGWRVRKSVSYMDDREIIFTCGLVDDDEGDD